MERKTIRKAHCIRCEHEWWPKTPATPVVCPKCQSPRWNIPRIQDKQDPPAPENKALEG